MIRLSPSYFWLGTIFSLLLSFADSDSSLFSSHALSPHTQLPENRIEIYIDPSQRPEEIIERLREFAHRTGHHLPSLRASIAATFIRRRLDSSALFSSQEEWERFLRITDEVCGLTELPSKMEIESPEQLRRYWDYFRVKGELLLKLADQGMMIVDALENVDWWAGFMGLSLVEGAFVSKEDILKHAQTLKFWLEFYEGRQTKETVRFFRFLTSSYLNHHVYMRTGTASLNVNAGSRFRDFIRMKRASIDGGIDLSEEGTLYGLVEAYLGLGSYEDAFGFHKKIPPPKTQQEKIRYAANLIYLYYGRYLSAVEKGEGQQDFQTESIIEQNLRILGAFPARAAFSFYLPNDPAARAAFGFHLLMQERDQELITMGEVVSKIGPQNIETAFLLVRGYLNRNDPSQCVLAFERFMKLMDEKDLTEIELAPAVGFPIVYLRSWTLQEKEEFLHLLFPVFQRAPLKPATRRVVYQIFSVLDQGLAEVYLQESVEQLRDYLWKPQESDPEKLRSWIQFFTGLDQYVVATIILAEVQEWMDYQEGIEEQRKADLDELKTGEFEQWKKQQEATLVSIANRINYLMDAIRVLGAQRETPQTVRSKRVLLREWQRLEFKITRNPNSGRLEEKSEFGTVQYFSALVEALYLEKDLQKWRFYFKEGIRLERYLFGEGIGRERLRGHLEDLEKSKSSTKKTVSHDQEQENRDKRVFRKKIAEEAAAFLHFANAFKGMEDDFDRMQQEIDLGLKYLDSYVMALDAFRVIGPRDLWSVRAEWSNTQRKVVLLVELLNQDNGFVLRAFILNRSPVLLTKLLRRVYQIYEISKKQVREGILTERDLYYFYALMEQFLIIFKNTSPVGVTVSLDQVSPPERIDWGRWFVELEQTRSELLNGLESLRSLLGEENIRALELNRLILMKPLFYIEEIWNWEVLLEECLTTGIQEGRAGYSIIDGLLGFIRVFNFLETHASDPQKLERISTEREKVARRILRLIEQYEPDQPKSITLNQKMVALLILRDWRSAADISDSVMDHEARFCRIFARSKMGMNVEEELDQLLKEAMIFSLMILDKEIRIEAFYLLMQARLPMRARERTQYEVFLAGASQNLYENLVYHLFKHESYLRILEKMIESFTEQEGPLLDEEKEFLEQLIGSLRISDDLQVLRKLRELTEDLRLQQTGWETILQAARDTKAAVEANRQGIIASIHSGINDACAKMDFATAVSLFEELEEERMGLLVEEQVEREWLMDLASAWEAYQRRDDDLAKRMLEGLELKEGMPAEERRVIKRFRERIERVISAEQWFHQGRMTRAEGSLNYLKNESIEDPRYESLMQQVTERKQRYQQLWNEAQELLQRLLEIKNQGNRIVEVESVLGELQEKITGILKIECEDSNALSIKLNTIAVEYYEMARQYSNQNRHLEALEIWEKVCQITEEIIQQNQTVNKTKNSSKEISLQEDAKQLRRFAKARIVLETMQIHRRVLDALVRAEESREQRLKNDFGMTRWGFKELQKIENGFWVRRFHSGIKVGRVFQVGESYRVYDKNNGLASSAYFSVAEIDEQKQQVRFEVVYEEDPRFALSLLPEEGSLERIPNTPARIQRLRLDLLIQALSGSFPNGMSRTQFSVYPSVGNGFLDRLLGLELAELNQRNELPLTLIQGPSGTGKTQVILAIALKYLGLDLEGYKVALDKFQEKAVARAYQQLAGVSPGKARILIVSQSNAGVDNVGRRLQERGIPFIRVGNNGAAVHEALRENWNDRQELLKEAKRNYDDQGQGFIILATNNGIQTDHYIMNDPFFKQFDVVIIEEAGRATLPETLIAARLAMKKLVLVGDHRQLPPYAVDDQMIQMIQKELSSEWNFLQRLFEPEIRRILKKSPFEELFEGEDGAGNERFTLLINRRMESLLAEFVSEIGYEGRIRPDPEREKVRDSQRDKKTLWLVDHDFPEESFALYNQQENGEDSQGTSRRNQGEAELVIQEMLRLLNPQKRGPPIYEPEQIMILTPYKAQIKLIRDLITQREERGELTPETAATLRKAVRTVDEIQGAENDVVILSLVRSNRSGRIGFLTDLHRLVVSISRQRKELHIIGNFTGTLNKAEYYVNQAESDPRKRRQQEVREEEVKTARTVYEKIYHFAKERGTLRTQKKPSPSPSRGIRYPGRSSPLLSAL